MELETKYVASTPGMVEDPLGFTFIVDKKSSFKTY